MTRILFNALIAALTPRGANSDEPPAAASPPPMLELLPQRLGQMLGLADLDGGHSLHRIPLVAEPSSVGRQAVNDALKLLKTWEGLSEQEQIVVKDYFGTVGTAADLLELGCTLLSSKGSARSFSARLSRLQFDQPQDDVAVGLTSGK
jgi:hypothetical protein